MDAARQQAVNSDDSIASLWSAFGDDAVGVSRSRDFARRRFGHSSRRLHCNGGAERIGQNDALPDNTRLSTCPERFADRAIARCNEFGYVPQSAALDATFPISAGEVVAMGAYGRLKPFQRIPAARRTAPGRCPRTSRTSVISRRALFFHYPAGKSSEF